MLRIDGNFITLRSFIRYAIMHVSFQVIYECEMNNDKGKLPEFPGSTINYFVPIPEKSSKIQLAYPAVRTSYMAADWLQ